MWYKMTSCITRYIKKLLLFPLYFQFFLFTNLKEGDSKNIILYKTISLSNMLMYFEASAGDNFCKLCDKRRWTISPFATMFLTLFNNYTPFEEEGVYRSHCVGLSVCQSEAIYEAIFCPAYFLQTTGWNSINFRWSFYTKSRCAYPIYHLQW